MHKIFRIFIILFLALSATTVVGQSCYNQPTYASMGSTGGGSTSTGGGSSSGGGGWSSSDSDSDADFFDLHSWGSNITNFPSSGRISIFRNAFF